MDAFCSFVIARTSPCAKGGLTQGKKSNILFC